MADETDKSSADLQRLELERRTQEIQLRIEEARLKLQQEDQDSRRNLEARRLKLDEDEQIRKNGIEITRLDREGTFFRANAAAIITAIVTLFATGIAGYQFYLNWTGQTARDVRDIQTKTDEMQLRHNELNLKVMDYISAHLNDIFSKDPDVVLRYRTVLLSTLPADVRAQVFQQLQQSRSPNAKLWVIGKISYRWTQVGTGDCGGHDVGRSKGSIPDNAFCGPSTEAHVSVCWHDWCTYKQATPQSCVGGASPGVMHQCIFDVQSDDSQQTTPVKAP